MSVRAKIEDKIKKKEQEIQEFKKKIWAAETYIHALQDTIKILPRDNIAEQMIIRPGSVIGKTFALLKKAQKPLYLNEIIEGIGKKVTKKERASLSGSLAGYVRRGEVFTRPAPNTYGLKEWSGTLLTEEPPPDFGLSDEETEGEKEKV